MTQIERTNAYLKTLEKGTILTKKEYEEVYYGLIKELRKNRVTENVYFSNWNKILQNTTGAQCSTGSLSGREGQRSLVDSQLLVHPL